MSETAINIPLPRTVATDKKIPTGVSRNGGTVRWYLLLALVITLGWLVREYEFISAQEGIGYWLGIAGGTLMLALLLYPLRKRIRFMHRLGATKYWFRMHMVFGLLGPLFILYHSNFHLGSFNSRVAFFSMLLVSSSGIVGRHFYARIHRGLYGRKTSLQEAQQELAASIEKSHGLAKFTPRLVARLDALAADLQDDAIRRTIGIRRSLKWTFTHMFVRLSLWRTARLELRVAAIASPVVDRDRPNIMRAASRYIRDYTVLAGRVAQFSLYERLFALWHILHLPIFFLMVLSAFVHVFAVHAY